MNIRLLLAASALALVSACAATPKAPATAAMTPAAGTVLADARGMTLYTFDRDSVPGKSACNGPCATNWPPMMAMAGAPAGDWTVITRDDGGKQWAYKGKPLYTWAKDTKPGDTTGDGFNNVWKVARP
jgi:predicted lipoprotein with Yx(FWY)xxD motif